MVSSASSRKAYSLIPNISLDKLRKSEYMIRIPVRRRDASRSSRNVDWAAMDAAASGMRKHAGRKRLQRTAKSCGPGAATLASSRVVSPTPATVAKEAAHRGEHV